MRFDLQAHLAGRRVDPTAEEAWELVGRLRDECLAWSARNGNAARRRYQQEAARVSATLPADLPLADMPDPLLPDWLAIEVDFELQTPWYSKDDRPFHVLDNSVRKDRVFGVPFVAAASWKGLLRWACRMEAGLHDHLAKHGTGPEAMDRWREPAWIVHLFGNARGADEHFSRGALQCFPTWWSKVGFEVINPHERARRAGTQPILYEVVPVGTEGTLRLLYAPPPGLAECQGVEPVDALGRLLEAAEKLLTVYGFSAKRTAGWGIARVYKWMAWGGPRSKARDGKELAALKAALPELLAAEGAGS